MRTLCRKSFAIGLLVAFLVVTTGRAVPVKAIGTTVAATAAAAFLATGVVYMSYLALTHADIPVPSVSDLGDYLTDVGRKVAQYPSGAATYQELYERYHVFNSPIGNVIDGVWSWTQEKLKAFVNDFSSTSTITGILGYEYTPVTDYTTNFDYPFIITARPNEFVRDYGGQSIPASTVDPVWYTGARIVYNVGSNYVGYNSIYTAQVRNYLKSDGRYDAQIMQNGQWVWLTSYSGNGYWNASGGYSRYNGNEFSLWNFSGVPKWVITGGTAVSAVNLTYPLFLDADIYVESTGETIPMVVPQTQYMTPQWNDPDNDYRPIIPFVDIPQLPANVPAPTGYTGIDQWGFNIEDLLDLLGDLGEAIFDLSVLKDLINGFAGLHGDNYYLEYNDGDTNYYITYQPNNYYNDYVTYNIDVSDVDEKLPVDLNTVAQYTNNRYIEAFKQHAAAGGSIIRDLVVFWYDVDPEIVYVVFGTCILTLIAAFIGKWGHS